MNKFVSSLLGSFVGTWIAFLLFGVVIFISGIIMIASLSLSNVSTPTAKINNNSVLRIDLNGEITERPMNKTLQEYINETEQNSLHNILYAIEKAETDNKISGIYVHVSVRKIEQCGDRAEISAGLFNADNVFHIPAQLGNRFRSDIHSRSAGNVIKDRGDLNRFGHRRKMRL